MKKLSSLLLFLSIHKRYISFIPIVSAFIIIYLQTSLTEIGLVHIIIFDIMGLAFILSACLLLYFKLFHKVIPIDITNRSFSEEEAALFWNTLKRRYWLFLMIGASWVVLAIPIGLIYSTIYHFDELLIAMIPVLVIVLILSTWAGWSIQKMICYNCGKTAFASCFFIIDNAKCQYCGIFFKQINDKKNIGRS